MPSLEDFEKALREALPNWKRVKILLLYIKNDGVEILSTLLTELKSVAVKRKKINEVIEEGDKRKWRAGLVAVALAPFTYWTTLVAYPLALLTKKVVDTAILDSVNSGPRGSLEKYLTLFNKTIEDVRSRLRDTEEPVEALEQVVRLIRSCFRVNEAQAKSMLNTFLTWVSDISFAPPGSDSTNLTNASSTFIATLCLTTPARADCIPNTTSDHETNAQRGITATKTRVKMELDKAVRTNVTFGNQLRDLIFLLDRRIAQEGELFAAFVGVFFIKMIVTNAIDEIAALVATFSTNPAVDKFDDALATLDSIKIQIEKCLKSDERVSADAIISREVTTWGDSQRGRLIVNNISSISIARQLGRTCISTDLTSDNALTRQTVITKLRRQLDQLQDNPKMLSHYFSIVSAIEQLVNMDPSSIRLIWYDGMTYPEIEFYNSYNRTAFDEENRNLLDQCILPFYLLVRTFFPLDENDYEGLCCIYRLRCKLCERGGEHFSYVGQTVDLASTLEQYQRGVWVDYMEYEQILGNKNQQRLQSHRQTAYHATHSNRSFADIYEVDVCHFLNDYNEIDDELHRGVRKSWQTYYQWLLQAIQAPSQARTLTMHK